jgi:hypothetical protein
MSASAYYGILALFWMTGKPHFVGKRLRAFYGSTLLHDVVHDGSLSAVKWLLERGADSAIKNHEGETPLTIARKLGYDAIAELLASTENCDEGMSEERGKCWPCKKLKSRVGNAPRKLFGKGKEYDVISSLRTTESRSRFLKKSFFFRKPIDQVLRSVKVSWRILFRSR